MKLKDIKEKFYVTGEKGVYNLYDPNIGSSKCMNHRYLGTIHYDSSTNFIKVVNPLHYKQPDMEFLYYFDKKVTVDRLVETLYTHADSLPFPSEFYNPDLRISYRVMMMVTHYVESIGFKYKGRGWNWDSHMYVLDGIHPFSKKNYIPLEITFDEDKTTGCIKEHVGQYSWTECNFDGVDDAISKINSIVEINLLSSASFALKTEDKLSNSRDTLSDMTCTQIDVNTLKSYTGEMKDKTIKALEDALKVLRGENN